MDAVNTPIVNSPPGINPFLKPAQNVNIRTWWKNGKRMRAIPSFVSMKGVISRRPERPLDLIKEGLGNG
jgi:hypothetical protein